MTLCDEIYFEITMTGAKSEIKQFVSFLKSGELDEFFEITSDYIHYDDNFKDASDDESTSLIFSNDDWGIEIDEFEVDEFLDVFCRAAKRLDVRGNIYDIDDEEYSFVSPEGDSYYLNAKNIKDFNDEIDAAASEEEEDED